MTNKSTRSAVIVGGGIGGLSAALALAKHGCRVTVLEQADRFEIPPLGTTSRSPMLATV